MLDVVGGRTQLKKAGARYTGRCPFHEERRRASPSIPSTSSSTASAAARAATSSRSSGRRRISTSPVPSSGSATGSACRSSTRRLRRRGCARNDASGCTPCSSRRRRSTSGTCGKPRRASRSGVSRRPRPEREDVPRVPARPLADGAGARAQGCRERIHPGRAGCCRARQPARQRLLLREADVPAGRRAGAWSATAPKLREDDPLQAKYVNSPEGDLFHKSSVLYGLHLARQAIAKEERAIVVEGNTDAIALRQAGSSRWWRRWAPRSPNGSSRS